jgi:hypothetical protein
MQPISATVRSGFLLLPGLEVAQFADGLVLGALAHDAGVEHDHVGLVEIWSVGP